MTGEPGDDGGPAVEEAFRFLARLAAPPGQPPPGRLPGAGSETVAALLDTIDETVMSRQLQLANRAGARLQLDVCNRRLLRLHGGADTPADLGYAGGADMSSLLGQLLDFVAPGGVMLRRVASEGAVHLGEAGIAAATLRQAWADTLAPVETSAPPPLPGTLHDLGAPVLPLCRSWVCHDPERESTADGPEDEIDRLVAVLERVSPEVIGSADPSALLLDNGDDALLLLRWGDGFAAFLLPAADGIAAVQALGLARFRTSPGAPAHPARR